MSTEATAQESSWGQEQPESRVMPKKLVCGVVKGIGNVYAPDDLEAGYHTAEILIDPTRGSNGKIKTKLQFRPEMFAPGFTKSIYATTNEDGSLEVNPKLRIQTGTNKKGQPKILGSSFWWVYTLNIVPKTAKNKEKVEYIKDQTPLSVLAGGSMVGWQAMLKAVGSFQASIPTDREANYLGLRAPTGEEVVEFLKNFIANNPQHPQIFELTQQRDFRTNELTDFFEVSKSYGMLTADLAKALQRRVADTRDKPKNEQVKMAFSLA